MFLDEFLGAGFELSVRMTTRLYLIAVACLITIKFSTAAAQSASLNSNPLKSFLNHATLFANCTADQEQKISSVLEDGLSRLASMNPDLIADRIAFTGTRQAEFDCSVKTKISSTSDAETYLRSNPFPFIKGKLMKVAKLRIGKVFSSEQSFAPETILLHEFLHFMSMDSLPVSLHNDPDVVYSSAIFYFDTVFSCSVAAFPVENAFYKPGMIARLPIHTDWMATTCKASSARGNEVVVNVQDLDFLNTKLRGSVACYLLTKGFKNRPKGKFNQRPEWAKVADHCESEK